MNGDTANRKVLCDMAQCAFEVVDRLLSRDQLFARDLRSPTATSRQVYREECITVEMATTLRERFPDHVEITLFTTQEETQNGADWYWRVERGSNAIHAQVQAKRIRRGQFEQTDNEGRVHIDGHQLNNLLNGVQNAADRIPGLQAWLATYARYAATPPCGERDLLLCPRHRHEMTCADRTPSLWIAQAQDFRHGNSSSWTVQEVVERSVRLDCILPCMDGPEVSDGPAKKGFMLSAGLLPYQACVARIRSDAGLRATFEGAMRIAV